MLFFGALLCSAGSPGAGSPTSQLVLRAPTSRRPAGSISLAVPFLSSTGASRLHPRFLDNPWIRAVVRDPGEPDATIPVDPVALRVGIGLRREQASRRSRLEHFGACATAHIPAVLRFVVTVARVLLTTTQRLASDVRGLRSSSAGLSPGVTSRSFRCYLLSSSTRLALARCSQPPQALPLPDFCFFGDSGRRRTSCRGAVARLRDRAR
jgi:hypothetical protein